MLRRAARSRVWGELARLYEVNGEPDLARVAATAAISSKNALAEPHSVDQAQNRCDDHSADSELFKEPHTKKSVKECHVTAPVRYF